uniref:Uncharacterized protein n=1 Tax=Helianthus annuus TaxID=4232 RepID=A0A251T442_HELAN
MVKLIVFVECFNGWILFQSILTNWIVETMRRVEKLVLQKEWMLAYYSDSRISVSLSSSPATVSFRFLDHL